MTCDTRDITVMETYLGNNVGTRYSYCGPLNPTLGTLRYYRMSRPVLESRPRTSFPLYS